MLCFTLLVLLLAGLADLVNLADFATAKRLAGQGQHFLALQRDGQVFGAGYNYYGQLGLNTNTSAFFPQRMLSVTNATDVSAGTFHSCLIEEDSQVKCTGFNVNYQLGDGTNTPRYMLVSVLGLDSGIEEVHCGYDASCATMTSGKVQCWGKFINVVRISPVNTTVSGNIQSISLGSTHACIVEVGGKLYCLGINVNGQLGTGNKVPQTEATQVVDLAAENIVSVACGNIHTCATNADGAMFCWGATNNGQLGNSSITLDSPFPVQVTGITSGAASAWTGQYSSFALMQNGTVWAFGRDYYGAFGTGSIGIRPVPVVYGQGVSGVVEIRGGHYTTCILLQNDRVWCTGSNFYGQLGIGSATNFQTLVEMLLPSSAPTILPTAEPTAQLTAEPTAEPTLEPTKTPTTQATGEPTLEPTTEPTVQPTVAPTVEPTQDPTLEPTLTPTSVPTFEPTLVPTSEPTLAPTNEPTLAPTVEPTQVPTLAPSAEPTTEPTLAPTTEPTQVPTLVPTTEPTLIPTSEPTVEPPQAPTLAPTSEPITESTAEPTLVPTVEPTFEPTLIPTAEPTLAPTSEPVATAEPTLVPTVAPTFEPTLVPTVEPTLAPASEPTAVPTQEPTAASTLVPTVAPNTDPTANPTVQPTVAPTQEPTSIPTLAPTTEPTVVPTATPVQGSTAGPTAEPTLVPTSEPTSEPTAEPTLVPTNEPTSEPAATVAPTNEPTPEPIQSPVEPPTVPANPICLPVIGTDKTECATLIKTCAKSDVTMFWAGAGCRVNGVLQQDGGCQCRGYCGYTCAKSCNLSSGGRCKWNNNLKACTVAATGKAYVPRDSKYCPAN